MAQSAWNGFLRLSLVSCPVSLTPVASDRHRQPRVSLNSRTGNPVAQQFVDAKTGDVVADDALVGGYRVADDRYLRLGDDELAAIRAAGGRILDIEHFVPADQIDRLHVDAVFYLQAEGQLAADTVDALRLAMARNRRVGLGRIQIGDEERLALIEPRGGTLLLATLHSVEAMQAPPEARPDDAVPAEMIEIAESIIGRRAAVVDRTSLHDRFEARLRALLGEKTGAVSAPAPEAESEPEPEPEPEPAPHPQTEPAPAVTVAAAVEPPPVAAAVERPPPAPPPEPEAVVLPAAAVAGLVERAAAAVQSPATVAEPADHGAADPVAHSAAEPAAAEPTAAEPTAAEPAATSDHGAAEPAAAEPGPESAGPRDLGAEILLHIVGLGDRRYVEPGWAGNPGSHREIEALSIRPGEGLPASAVEFKVFAQEGRATSWVSEGNYAGTRGRGLPLTGFAIRPAPDQTGRLEIVYEGCFFEGGVVGPKRDGELCISPIANDPLEAVRVSILEHTAG